MQQRKHLTAEQKSAILRELLDNQTSISVLSEKYGVHPNDIYRWKKQLFEGAATLLQNKHKNKKSQSHQSEMIRRLEEKLRYKDQVISELAQDNISLKKSIDGEV